MVIVHSQAPTAQIAVACKARGGGIHSWFGIGMRADQCQGVEIGGLDVVVAVSGIETWTRH